MITMTERFWMPLGKAVFIGAIIYSISSGLVRSEIFQNNPIIAGYPYSWPMVVAGCFLLLIGWRLGKRSPMKEAAYTLPAAALGVAAAVIAARHTCIAGFNGFNSFALLFLARPLWSLFYGGYLWEHREMPGWAWVASYALLGAGIYAMFASATSYHFPQHLPWPPR